MGLKESGKSAARGGDRFAPQASIMTQTSRQRPRSNARDRGGETSRFGRSPRGRYSCKHLPKKIIVSGLIDLSWSHLVGYWEEGATVEKRRRVTRTRRAKRKEQLRRLLAGEAASRKRDSLRVHHRGKKCVARRRNDRWFMGTALGRADRLRYGKVRGSKKDLQHFAVEKSHAVMVRKLADPTLGGKVKMTRAQKRIQSDELLAEMGIKWGFHRIHSVEEENKKAATKSVVHDDRALNTQQFEGSQPRQSNFGIPSGVAPNSIIVTHSVRGLLNSLWPDHFDPDVRYRTGDPPKRARGMRSKLGLWI